MTNGTDLIDQPADRSPKAAPVVRMIAQGGGWSVAEYICSAGPGDRSFEEKHEAFTIAAVVEGSFRYRADTGTSLLHPGAVLLGNFGTCFTCGHDHSRGDRCIAFHLSPEYFAEVSATAGGTAKYRFSAAMLPFGQTSFSWLARTQSIIARGEALEIDEAITELVETVITASLGATSARQSVSANDERRISAALHLLERNFSETVDLDQLATVAVMSKYHFVRTFRRVAGMTPYQYLLGLRLRHVAVRLINSSAPISMIAFEAGFGDLSTFVSRFRHQFGESPSRYRARYRDSARYRNSAIE